MNLIKYLFVVFVALMFSHTKLSAQNILTSTIEWKSNLTLDVQLGIITDEVTRIVTSPTQIIWYDANDTVRQTFDIGSPEGSWSNVANNGSIIFRITSGELPGIVQLVKTGGDRSIRIHLVHDNESASTIYNLTITDVNAL